MNLIEYPVSWYLDKMARGEHFSIAMFGDGEWQCIANAVLQDRYIQNAEKTEYTPKLSQAMAESLKFDQPNCYFAVPDTFRTYAPMKCYETSIDRICDKLRVKINFVEKNCWNRAMCEAKMYPIISEFRKHNVCIVSNKMLKGLTFLKYDKFVEVGYPNCYADLERATDECLEYGKSGIYLFACGIPAALFVQRLHGKIKDSWFLDLGSIWDGFAGIGGQRPTRREFYRHPDEWKKWRDENLREIDWETKELPKVDWFGMGSKEINPNL
jgi:hypothetical protein